MPCNKIIIYISIVGNHYEFYVQIIDYAIRVIWREQLFY